MEHELLPVQGTIEGRRDIAGGRSTIDRRAAGNSTSGQCFTSLAFSADGSWLLAGKLPNQGLLSSESHNMILKFMTNAWLPALPCYPTTVFFLKLNTVQGLIRMLHTFSLS